MCVCVFVNWSMRVCLWMHISMCVCAYIYLSMCVRVCSFYVFMSVCIWHAYECFSPHFKDIIVCCQHTESGVLIGKETLGWMEHKERGERDRENRKASRVREKEKQECA